MGGTGSGFKGKAKLLTSQLFEARVSELTIPPQATEFSFRFEATYADMKSKPFTEKIAWTNCNFGGCRPWFVCRKCGDRCGVLYGLSAFGFPLSDLYCRKCLKLNYPCQCGDTRHRLEIKLRNIAHKLKRTPPNPYRDFDLHPECPKGMHWSRFEKLDKEYRELQVELYRLFNERTAKGFQSILKSMSRRNSTR